jgi:hypothetical protein
MWVSQFLELTSTEHGPTLGRLSTANTLGTRLEFSESFLVEGDAQGLGASRWSLLVLNRTFE